LFADMVGFTTFSERSGEEAAFTLMRSLSKLMDEAVRDEGGIVRGFTGDGIMAVFGAPTAFEDAPLRACRTALSILQRLRVAGGELLANYGVRPQLRIGLNTGPAVVGRVQGDASAGVTVLGDTVNFAARLQALAEPDSVFMSAVTHRFVQGLVEARFAGEHPIKGKTELQRVYRLDAIRQGATRFETALSRGLGAFVGRERELEVLERGLEEARSKLCVIDLVAEPGMGKSRLLHEFGQRINKDRVFVLSASCAPDGQQTAFLPFIKLMRGSFRISAGEPEKDIEEKLSRGLSALGLHSDLNISLLLHLLGLKAPDGALTGLDGMLIGQKTRELLQQLLEARCDLSPVVMVVEDLHWIDSVSAEVLGKIVDRESKRRLLLLHTRRPEYSPPWLNSPVVTQLRLDPLRTGDIRRLIQTRLGVEALPEALARQVTDKAEGNPLFAEEIVSFLTERGMLCVGVGNKLEFNADAVTATLPSSVQSLLTARVDRLAPRDRALLQAASVIGRHFDPDLLAAVVGVSDIDARLDAMGALDLVRREGKSNDYVFKHALVRDALYQSLLSMPRHVLHLKVAEEIEHRSGNRLTEVAEILAHHYSQTNHTGKAFAYLALAGAKSLGVYSLDEAATHFAAALALLDKNPDCASDDQVAEFLVPYTAYLSMSIKIKMMISVLERYLARIDSRGDDPRTVLIRHHYVFALLWNARYREAAAVQKATSQITSHLKDSRSKAYTLAGEIQVSTIVEPKQLDEFEAIKREAIKAASTSADAYIQSWMRYVIGWEEIHRGRMNEARDSARELMRVGRTLNDPRSTGLGLALLTWIALMSDSYSEALEYSEQALAVAITPLDRETGVNARGCALVLLRQTEQGAKVLEEFRQRADADGDLYSLVGCDPFFGLSQIFQGNIGEGIRLIEEAISRREKDGYRVAADWYRLTLGEVYLKIIEGNEKLSLPNLLKNLPILLKVMITATSRVRALMMRVLENHPQLHPAGYFAGRAQMILGLLYKVRKKRLLAAQHLTEAKRILSQFGPTPMLARVNTALAELGQ
jgi:class 3 adenylate cyclase/tetratricopeptide (TPR) repeat protein